MYCSITQQETKRRPASSGVCKKPKWKPSRKHPGEYEIIGEEIPREARPKWRISIGDTFKDNGRPRRKQWYIGTVTYWDIVDDRYGPESGFLEADLAGRVHRHFAGVNGYDCDRVLGLIHEKLGPIREAVLREYQDSDEHYYRLIQDFVARKKRESAARKSQKGCRGTGAGETSGAHSGPDDGPRAGRSAGASPRPQTGAAPTGQDLAAEIVRHGFKKIAPRYHPDTGGDPEAMQKLNGVKDRLLEIIEKGAAVLFKD